MKSATRNAHQFRDLTSYLNGVNISSRKMQVTYLTIIDSANIGTIDIDFVNHNILKFVKTQTITKLSKFTFGIRSFLWVHELISVQTKIPSSVTTSLVIGILINGRPFLRDSQPYIVTIPRTYCYFKVEGTADLTVVFHFFTIENVAWGSRVYC